MRRVHGRLPFSRSRCAAVRAQLPQERVVRVQRAPAADHGRQVQVAFAQARPRSPRSGDEEPEAPLLVVGRVELVGGRVVRRPRSRCRTPAGAALPRNSCPDSAALLVQGRVGPQDPPQQEDRGGLVVAARGPPAVGHRRREARVARERPDDVLLDDLVVRRRRRVHGRTGTRALCRSPAAVLNSAGPWSMSSGQAARRSRGARPCATVGSARRSARPKSPSSGAACGPTSGRVLRLLSAVALEFHRFARSVPGTLWEAPGVGHFYRYVARFVAGRKNSANRCASTRQRHESNYPCQRLGGKPDAYGY